MIPSDSTSGCSPSCQRAQRQPVQHAQASIIKNIFRPGEPAHLEAVDGAVLHAQCSHTVARPVLAHDQVQRKVLHKELDVVLHGLWCGGVHMEEKPVKNIVLSVHCPCTIFVNCSRFRMVLRAAASLYGCSSTTRVHRHANGWLTFTSATHSWCPYSCSHACRCNYGRSMQNVSNGLCVDDTPAHVWLADSNVCCADCTKLKRALHFMAHVSSTFPCIL